MRIDSPIMTNAVGTGSFSGSFSGIHYGDGSNLTGVTSYTDADTLSYINSLNVLSGSDAYTTDVELNSSSSALISGYTNADASLSSSLATALTSEYTSADTTLSSSLAADIAVNTAKVGYTDSLVKTKLNAENVVSASSFSSPSQGTVRATINGVNTDVDTGLQAGDSPTFANLVVTGNLTVEGSRTELQVTELNVEDKNILIASGAADSAAADGAGITIGGANESITWNHANSRFNISDDLNVEGNITLTGTVDGVDIAALNSTVSNLNDTYATDAELNASSSALITAYGNADSALSSSLATALTSEYVAADTALSSSLASSIASNLSAIQSNDTDISNLQTASGSFSTRVTTNENSISSLNTASGSFSTRVTSLESSLTNLNDTYATDAELNASSSALITAYTNADNALSSSLATALTSEYVGADSSLSSSLAADIAVNTAKIGVTTETVRTAGALMDDEVDADIKTLSLPASTTISAFGKTLVDDADAATARTTLGVDAAGTDNSTDVTLTGAYDYITITGQTITRNQITNDDLEGSIANAKLANSSITINGSAVSLGGTRTLVTDDIAEDGSPVNLWYTDTRVKTKLNAEGVISGSSQVNVSSTSGYQEPAIINNAGTPAFVTGITAAEVRTLLDVDPAGTDNSTDQNLFSTIAVSGQSSVVADTTSDTLTLAAGTNVSITTNATTDTITINSTDQYTGTVTSVGGTGTVNGLTLTGTVTTSGNLTLGGTLSNIANSALTNSSVSYGGVTLSLGGSDATPAFNLADATGLPIVAGTTGTLSVARGGTGATSAGTAATNLGLGTADNVSFASVSTSGNVTVGGDLTVLGSRTELQVTSLNVEDKNILIASGALDSAAADGAGITIGGANETITWDHANSRFSFSDDVHVGGNITVTGTVDGVDILALSNTVGGINTQVPAIYDNAGTPALNTGITEAEIKTLLNLEIGTDVQAYNSTLAAVAGGTYTGDDSITTVGTIGTGTWNGSVIASAYLDADTMHLGVAQSITANKTFNDSVKAIFGTGGDLEIYHDGANSVIKDAGIGVLELQTNGTEIQLTGASGADYMARFINNGAVNLYHDNSLKLATAAGGVDVTGGITATGDIVAYYSSDRELKENIIPIENALEKVEALGGYEFDWNDKQDVYSGHDLGVIAQEVEAVLPELVQTRDNGYKAVKYEKLTAVLIQAVKELSARVKELESK